MVISTQRRRLFTAFGTVCAAAFLCQCETKRTVKSVETNFSFSEQMWGPQGNNDSQKIRNKFAESGYTLADDGSIVADDPNLYEGEKARGVDSSFDKKRARFGKKEARTKEFRTPEYLERQQFAGTEEARESDSDAREGNFGQSRDRAAGRLFGRDSEDSTELASFDGGRFRGEERTFATRDDPIGSEAVRNSPRARGTAQGAGYSANASLTLDDVKKMVEPGVYARAKRLEE